ncbi:MAG: hypothetical protein ACRDHE_02805, partial [Ktedonobacterales bacterium]
MIVLKFGGSSLADAARIRNAARIVAARHAQEPVICVVSAVAGVTDSLLRIATRGDIGSDSPSPYEAGRREVREARHSLAEPAPERNVGWEMISTLDAVISQHRRLLAEVSAPAQFAPALVEFGGVAVRMSTCLQALGGTACAGA